MGSLIHEVMGRLPTSLVKRISALQFSSPAVRRLLELGSRGLRHKDLTIRQGVGAGLRFNTGDSNVGYVLGTTEVDFQQLLASLLQPGQTFYDVGAHVGFFTVLGGRLVGAGGRVVAFEPLPANVQALRHNVELNDFAHVRVVDAAVANTMGTLELQLVGNSTGPKLALAGRDAGSKGSVQVATVALDAWLRETGERPPDLLKIDVEGAEIEVIQGMRETIERTRPRILCEMHGRNREYVELMTSLGYDVRPVHEAGSVADGHWNMHTLATPVSGAAG